jgi:type IV pilus assembly protein PilA
MISVAILGLLAAVAIPNFLTYQAGSRRSEAYSNVQAIANMENTYFAENDVYFLADESQPDFTDPAVKPNGTLDTDKMSWNADARAEFAGLGWAPEGTVFYSYEVNTDCGGEPSFTVTAYGNTDGDALYGAVQYAKPDVNGAMCDDLLGLVGFPIRVEEVVVNDSLDPY